ncbi:MAG: DinB family protein [Roseiflexaceae bacterium]|nr:DinB family protein [Roseiflexaceae bacterium]
MDTAYFCDLYRYTYWANRKVWACVEQLNDEQFTQELDYSIGALRNQCIHTMGVESWWITFLATGTLQFLSFDDYPTRASVRAKWDEIERYVLGYLDSLTPDQLQREVHPDFWEDDPPIKLWQALLQVANHSTDHRAQILAGLHRLGGPTVGQDYLDYLDEQQKQLH